MKDRQHLCSNRQPRHRNDVIACQASFKDLCQWPRCDCDRNTSDNTVGSCRALWHYNGGETSQWNGDSCDCEYVQGNLNCKLNPN